MIDISKWAFENKKLIYFLIAVLIVGGAYSSYEMSKLEDPEITVKARHGGYYLSRCIRASGGTGSDGCTRKEYPFYGEYR